MKSTLFYNSQHSPIGAFASFTLGARGAKGGLGLELGKPADENVYIGLENARGGFDCLPFFDAVEDESKRFDVSASGEQKGPVLRAFEEAAIAREMTPCADVWRAGELEFRIFTPVCAAPDPARSPKAAQKLAYAPALAVELTVDNRKGKRARRAIFGYQGNNAWRGMRRLDDTAAGRFVGVGCGDSTAVVSWSPGVRAAQGFTAEQILEERHELNQASGLGGVGLLVGEVPAGKKVTFQFAVCFFRGGIVTTGMKGSYYYTRFFADIEAVAGYALANFEALKARGADFERRFQRSRLGAERKFMLAHAIHSYFGSTELLEIEGEGVMWIVNEGEYRMMNTFDLTVDQLFFEMNFNPWTVANELDWFVRRYSYRDKVRLPGQPREYAGGLSFTHDMGVANHFARPGYSVYEKTGLEGCFSYMTHEELVNWLVCGLVYAKRTGDRAWQRKLRPVFEACFQSLINRDHPVAAERDGVMSMDSSRCSGGGEITTYDSLDVSLGQARNNLYLAVKCWGVYVGLEEFFAGLGDERRSREAGRQAERCAAAVCASADAEGWLPAILHENVPSRIIPAIEGLVIPYALGLGEALEPKGRFGSLIETLRRHLSKALQPGVCLLADGGWRISSTSENTWQSKVYLCQFIAERILAFPPDLKADQAHMAMLLDPRNLYWAWSDQMIRGEAVGSKYYPRGVTAILWMEP